MPKPKKQTWLLLLPAVLVVLCAMVWLFSSQEDATGELTPADGVLDACGADFAHTVYTLGSDWTFYPETLASTQADLRGRETGAHDESVPYGTYRLELLAQPGQYLVLSGYSFDYSTRVYLDGQQVLEIGKVADTAAASEARINYMDIPIYTGEDGRVEIVCQYANFVHKEGGSLPRLYLSSPEKTQEMQRGNDLYSLALSGGLCLFGCYFLLLAAIQRGPKYGFLAMTCWLMGMRNQNFYVVHLLHPEYNWALAYRFLVWMIALQTFALLLLLANLYRGAVKRWVVWCYVGAYGVLSALHFILPTQQVKELTRLCYDVSVPFFVYLIFCLIRRLIRTRTVHWEDGLILLGYALLLGADVYEAWFGRIVLAVTRRGTAPPYMLLFVFLMAVAIGVQSNRQREELAESRRQQQVLTQLNQLKTDFLHQIAHELKTPLTVISGYAQLTNWQLAQGQADQGMQDHMTVVSSEAQRLSALVSELIELSKGGGRETQTELIELPSLFEAAAKVCQPLLDKRQNQLVCTGGAGLCISGNRGMLLQLLINLTMNANKHTQGGTITYRASLVPGRGNFALDTVRLLVEDTGEGIPEERIPYIFDKGYSGDGGSGIGLYICQDVVKYHGGTLTLASTGPGGTTFRILLPRTPEAAQPDQPNPTHPEEG